MQPAFSNGMYAETYEAWNPQKIAEKEERKDLVHKAINQLPDDYRAIVTLRDIEELSTTEVAEILDISEGAVRVRLHRARQALTQDKPVISISCIQLAPNLTGTYMNLIQKIMTHV